MWIPFTHQRKKVTTEREKTYLLPPAPHECEAAQTVSLPFQEERGEPLTQSFPQLRTRGSQQLAGHQNA